MVVLTSFSPPTEGIRHTQPSTTLYVKGREVGVGTLYIAESNLSWQKDSSGDGFSLCYRNIAIHGISRDTAQAGSECLYVMVDTCLDEFYSEDDGDTDDDNPRDSTEMRFAPADKGQLDEMYRAMSHCQSLNPDSDVSSVSEEDEQYEDAENEEGDPLEMGDGEYIVDHHSHGEPINGLRSAEEVMELDDLDGQFEDAED